MILQWSNSWRYAVPTLASQTLLWITIGKSPRRHFSFTQILQTLTCKSHLLSSYWYHDVIKGLN